MAQSGPQQTQKVYIQKFYHNDIKFSASLSANCNSHTKPYIFDSAGYILGDSDIKFSAPITIIANYVPCPGFRPGNKLSVIKISKVEILTLTSAPAIPGTYHNFLKLRNLGDMHKRIPQIPYKQI